MDRTSRAVSGKLQRGEGSGDSRRPRSTCPVCPGAGSSCGGGCGLKRLGVGGKGMDVSQGLQAVLGAQQGCQVEAHPSPGQANLR